MAEDPLQPFDNEPTSRYRALEEQIAALASRVETLEKQNNDRQKIAVEPQRPLIQVIYSGKSEPEQFFLSIQHHDNERLRAFLHDNPYLIDAEREDNHNTRPLTSAVLFGNAEAFEILLDAGADPHYYCVYESPDNPGVYNEVCNIAGYIIASLWEAHNPVPLLRMLALAIWEAHIDPDGPWKGDGFSEGDTGNITEYLESALPQGIRFRDAARIVTDEAYARSLIHPPGNE